jgi:hypothetical protein
MMGLVLLLMGVPHPDPCPPQRLVLPLSKRQQQMLPMLVLPVTLSVTLAAALLLIKGYTVC